MSLTNKVIGNYKLTKKVGEGGFATVWVAEHTITKVQVAVKAIKQFKPDDAATKKLFDREIALLKQIRHPFISELFEVHSDADYNYLAMEYVPGGNLLEVVNKTGKIPEEKARLYFAQLIASLDYLHVYLKIAHRDLKPENVLLDSHGNARLIDFGLGNQLQSDQEKLKTTCGSPAYAAPELFTKPSYTMSADVWSAGVLLYSIIAGTLPFNANNMKKLVLMIINDEVKYPDHFSEPLQDLLKSMLKKVPEERIDITAIKNHRWFTSVEQSIFKNPHLVSAGDPEIDPAIIAKLKGFGIDGSGITKDLLKKEFNSTTAAYRMLAKLQQSDDIEKEIAAFKK